MRPSRRRILRWGAGAASAALAAGVALRAAFPSAGSDEIVSIEVRAAPIPAFLAREPDRRRFGALVYRGGLALGSEGRGFGGVSSLWRSPDGAEIVAVTDRAQWLTARVDSDGGRITGLASVRMAPLLDEGGRPMHRGRSYDTEGLAIADGEAFVSIERVHEVRRFAWARDGFAARGVPLPLPPEVGTLPDNRSLEAVGVAPPGHALAGAVVAIAERARSGEDSPTLGWVLTGPERFAFEVARSEGFDVTDIAFLASGEMLILERRYSPLRGPACRIRRAARDAIRPGAAVDGETLMEADRSFEIDNMEGLAVHRDPATGETVLTIVSDDNFSPLQRTLLLEFALVA